MAIRKIKYCIILFIGILFSCNNSNSDNSERILKEKENEISRKEAILSQMKKINLRKFSARLIY